jgi:hypothetical protein
VRKRTSVLLLIMYIISLRCNGATHSESEARLVSAIVWGRRPPQARTSRRRPWSPKCVLPWAAPKVPKGTHVTGAVGERSEEPSSDPGARACASLGVPPQSVLRTNGRRA